jgi:hypothetical protein
MPSKDLSVTLTILLVLVSITCECCRAANSNQSTNNSSLENLVNARIGKDYAVEFNAKRTHALCYQKRSDDHAQRTIQFIVVRLEDNKEVADGTFKMGYVKWKDNATVEVLSTPQGTGEGVKKEIKISGNEN